MVFEVSIMQTLTAMAITHFPTTGTAPTQMPGDITTEIQTFMPWQALAT
jgi:hypothetical protein